ncbi:MAG: 3'(2'),5'-bisphosphate nucleotidase [Phycisphaerales bacterium JB063]
MLEQELLVAVRAVRRACWVTQKVQSALVSADTLEKKDKSPVTVADFASQAVVCRALAEHFPLDPVVGEEGADDLRGDEAAELREAVRVVVGQSLRQDDVNEAAVLSWIDRGAFDPAQAEEKERKRYWTLDPIDGTKGFLRKEHYAVALALIEDGEVVLGVLGCPKMQVGRKQGAIFTAVRGRGAQALLIDSEELEGEPITVASRQEVEKARFCESVESGHSSHDDAAKIAEKLGITKEPYRIDSQCKYAAIGKGSASIYLRLPTKKGYEEKIWDHAAGVIVVEEAGGVVTDVKGEKLDFSIGRTLRDNTGVVATNGKFHDEVIEAVRAVLGV